MTSSEAAVDVPVSGSGYLAVINTSTGNMAVTAVKPDTKSVKLKATDFKYVAEVQVAVSHDGLAVQSASVDLKDGRATQTGVIDPSRNGVVSFYAVQSGSATVTVHYVSQGKDADPLVQIVKVPLTRTEPGLQLAVALTADVETLKTKAGAASGSSAKRGAAAAADGKDSASGPTDGGEPKTTRKDPTVIGIVTRIVGVLLGVGVVVGVAWALWYFLIKNPSAAQERLTALGVQIPQQQGDPLQTPAVAVPTAAPQPIQPIMLDDAAPTPIASSPLDPYAAGQIQLGTPPAPLIPGSFSDNPRLVKADGEELFIQSGTSTIGREAGLTMSLVDESTLSRKHAEITRVGSNLTLRDLGSTNGTFVNGRKVTDSVNLNPGDQVQFGSVMFTVQA